jgi:hypothetical protein
MLIIILLPLNVGKVAVLALETLYLSSTKPIREEGLLQDVDREKQRTGLPTRDMSPNPENLQYRKRTRHRNGNI